MDRSVRRAAACGLAVLACVSVLLGQAPPPEDRMIVFESPTEGSYVSGPLLLRVQVAAPGIAVRSVSLYMDGQLVCTLLSPPFECAAHAGPNVVEHVVRATALLADGRRIASQVRTKDAGYSETVDVDVLQITATVTGDRGRFVRGLTAADFRVYEDGVLQPITYFASENIPLEILVAVDVSISMTQAIPTVRAAVKKFLSRLRPQDRVTVLGFNHTVFTVARPGVDLPTRLRNIDRLSAWGGTALYDVIIRGVDSLGAQPGRRALVVFSDGEDLHSKVPLQTAERRLEASDAVLYAVGQGRAPGMLELRQILDRLADKSGGRAIFEDLEGLDKAFDTIIEDLANQYLIAYVPRHDPRDGRWHDQRVEVPGRDVRIRSKRGYRFDPK